MLQDLDEVEEWNEFGEIKENIGDIPPASSAPAPGGEAVTTRATMHPTTTVQPPAPLPVKPTATAANKSASDKTEPLQTPMANLSMEEAATEAAAIGAARKGPAPGINDTKVAPLKSPTQTSSLAEPSEAPGSSKAPEPAPLSAVESSDDLAAAVATPAGTIQQKHRGSSVSNANPEEIKELEQSSAIPEADDEDEEQPKTQEQKAAVADKASVSVQD